LPALIAYEDKLYRS